jgi:hypothetical protein
MFNTSRFFSPTVFKPQNVHLNTQGAKRMSRLLRGVALFLCLFLMFAALPALAQDSQSSSSAQAQQRPGAGNSTQVLPVVNVLQHGVPVLDPSTRLGPVGFAAPAGAHLTYFGGPIISNVHVVQVLYGSGSYNAQVAGSSSPTMGNFYGDITGANSGYVSLLTQYNTTVSGGTNQTIGNGSFDGLFQISPSAGNNGSTISDAQIQSELLAQITAGHLPAPILDAAGNVNTLYMIFFPPGKTITQGGSSSCVAGGFCAYHGTTSSLLNGKNVLYGVMPDMQTGLCATGGCGSSSVFGNYTSVTSHELTEAITDADVGIATVFGPPLAWYDMNNGEIGDICNGQQGSYTANGTTYTIQLEFSNAANNCVLPPPANQGPNFSLAASPSSLTVTQGSSGNSTITVTPSGGFTGSVTLSASGLPAGVTATFGTNPTTSTSVLTLTASSTATVGTATVTITGTSGTLTHTTTVTLTVNSAGGNPDFTISASPSTLTVTRGSSGHYTVTITGTNGFAGTVSLSVSGLGSRVTGTFSPTSVTGSGTSTLTITVNRRATTGNRALTITGTSGALSHSTNATLTIQ